MFISLYKIDKLIFFFFVLFSRNIIKKRGERKEGKQKMLIKTAVRPPSVATGTCKLQHVNDNNSNSTTSSKVRLVVLGNPRVGKSGTNSLFLLLLLLNYIPLRFFWNLLFSNRRDKFSFPVSKRQIFFFFLNSYHADSPPLFVLKGWITETGNGRNKKPEIRKLKNFLY